MGKNKTKSLAIILFLISLLGIIDSGYLTYAHYKPGAADFCSIKPDLDCDLVNQSEFSTVDGVINFLFSKEYYIPVPMAVLSSTVFLLLFISTLIIFGNISSGDDNSSIRRFLNHISGHLLRFCGVLLLISTSFGMFLIYVQASILKTWCILCILLDLLIFSSLAIVWMITKKLRGGSILKEQAQ